MNKSILKIGLYLSMLAFSVIGNHSLASTVDNQQEFEQQLDDILNKVKTIRSQEPDRKIWFDSGYAATGYYGDNKVNLNDALKADDYAYIRKVLIEGAHSIRIYKGSKKVTRLDVHPYQNKNTAYKVVQAILNEDANELELALESVDNSLEEKVYVDDAMGFKPLSFAVEKQYLPAVAALLNAGADPNHTEHGASVLDSAVYYKRPDFVELLLDAGVDKNSTLSTLFNSKTLLSHSAANGYVGLLKRLIDSGADANLVDLHGWTPLMEAIHAQSWDAFELLLPVSDITIVSTKAVKRNDRKRLDREYPLCNAMFIAEQIDKPVGQRIRQALLAKARD